ncbi:hypothetical protein [Pseudomonas sp. SBB6]|uniref:hypothetical protein n=1 Tax=Pseudomonas sp. SBB6 TaxID=2962032 RepID=UPI0020B6A651|nr:hypothetical protein [Pseudomonas sp. SBB6]MCP3750988.1 hypothetical protein [Pseudomonas sp. SBB6]
MDNSWNLTALRTAINARKPKQHDRLIEIINSLGRSSQIFEYHKRLARDAFTAFDEENDPKGIKYASHFFGCEDDQDAIQEADLISQANLISCIATTRNAYDSFGQLINSLVLPKPLTTKFYIFEVRDKLPAGKLKRRLNKALSSKWFAYTHAFMNEIKHHRLIVHRPTISFIDENRGGKIAGFKHKSKAFPEYWVREALEGTVELQNSLVACGKLLNQLYLEETPHQ